MLEAGPELDRAVALAVFGEARPRIPPYSTDDEAASRLGLSLADSFSLTCEKENETWYCVWWREIVEGTRERVATGSGNTKALAICLSILNLPSSRRAGVPRRLSRAPK